MLWRPIPLVAVIMLALNDHVFKSACPGLITGKLSDFAGLTFFPLFLTELWASVSGSASRRNLVIASVATGIVFVAVKLVPIAGEAYRWGLACLQWPWRAAWNQSFVPLVPVHLTQDPTDLLALPAIGVALWHGVRKSRVRSA